MRAEGDAHQFATQDALIAHVVGIARRTGLPCPDDIVERLTNVLAIAARDQVRRVEQDAIREARLRRALGFTPAWWAECPHRPKCGTPTQCALRTAKEAR